MNYWVRLSYLIPPLVSVAAPRFALCEDRAKAVAVGEAHVSDTASGHTFREFGPPSMQPAPTADPSEFATVTGEQPESAVSGDLAGITDVSRSASGGPLFPGLELSGFFDMLSTFADARLASNDHGINQAELGLATDIASRVGVELAVSYDAELETFGIGAAFVDWHLWDRSEARHRGSRGITHTGVIVGQFDVPFGIDIDVYGSADRLLISEPTVVVETHGAWSDVGVQA